MIQLIDPKTGNNLIETPDGLVFEENVLYPNKNGAYRIVTDDNYTENFGFQWNKFSKTQIDKDSKLETSKNRFFAETGWDKEDLNGKCILEVGSGAGRFSEVILNHTKAELYSLDYSSAVEANFLNNGPNPRLHLFQASIYEMPFRENQFDKVICLGVLQHTPDFEKSVKSLINMVKPGGELVVDFYPIKGFYSKLNAKYLLRPYAKRMSNENLFKKIERNIDWMITTSRFFTKIGIGRVTNRFIPIVDIQGTMPRNLTKQQLREWCILDTFDMFSPEFDNPQKITTVKGWFEKYGMERIWGGFIPLDNNSNAAVVKGYKSEQAE